jgi:hypothetical protein
VIIIIPKGKYSFWVVISLFILQNSNTNSSYAFLEDLSFFPSSLQLVLSFGLLNIASSLLYSEADCLVSEQFSFYGVRLLASRPTPKLEHQGIPLRLASTS